MSRAQKKLEIHTGSSLQLIPENPTGECTVIAADDCIEAALNQRKKEADKPLYLRRI